MKTYYEKPTQVVFADPDASGEWIVGIAYCDEIICGCCGGVFSIEEVIEMAQESGVKNAIHEYADWLDIANEISGGELPEGLNKNESGEIYEVSDEEYEQYAFTLEEEDEETARINEVENLN